MTSEWRDDADELRRTTIERLTEIRQDIEQRRARQERRRRIRRLSFGLLDR